jgi:hypothetical protein
MLDTPGSVWTGAKNLAPTEMFLFPRILWKNNNIFTTPVFTAKPQES